MDKTPRTKQKQELKKDRKKTPPNNNKLNKEKEASHLVTLELISFQMQRIGRRKMGVGGEGKEKEKKKNSALAERKKASQKIGTVRGAVGSPGVGSFNKFLAPTAVLAGKFTGNVYRPTEEFRQGQGRRKKKKKHQPQARALLQSAVSKCKIKKTNKQKSCFPIVAPPSNFLQKKKGGKKNPTHKNTTHKTWGVIAAPNFSP